MMNNANQISRQTKLFGFIGEHAGVSRMSAILNKTFKSNSDDSMMIPMNIREDDFFFTLSNMKNSQVNGAVISSEYVQKTLEVLDESSSLVKKSGMCDIVFRDGDKLRGDIFSIRVLLEKLKDIGATKVAVIGIEPYAKVISMMSCGFKLSYFNDDLEKLMAFTTEMELQNADMNRIADSMSLDFSSFDAVLNFSNLETLDMVETLAPYNFDMKNDKEFSALKAIATKLEANYTGYDGMIEELSAQAYKQIIKGNK